MAKPIHNPEGYHAQNVLLPLCIQHQDTKKRQHKSYSMLQSESLSRRTARVVERHPFILHRIADPPSRSLYLINFSLL